MARGASQRGRLVSLHLSCLATRPPTCLHGPRRTVMFIDEQGQQVSEKRLQLVQG